jgi:hypothetical protein
MSQRTEHILYHANELALEHYGESYYEVPKRVQQILFSMGVISARNEIKDLVNNGGKND